MTDKLEEKLNSLKDRLKALKDSEVKDMKTDVSGSLTNLNLVENYLTDLKTSAKLTVEEQEELRKRISDSCGELEKVIIALETEIKELKVETTKLKNKTAKVAGLCVGGGLLTGITLTMG